MLFYHESFKKIRENKCLTLEEIGERLGVSKQTVQKWEDGAVRPRPGKIYALARLLDVSVADLSDLRPEMQTEPASAPPGDAAVAPDGRRAAPVQVLRWRDLILKIINSDELSDAEKVKVLKVLQK